MSKHAWLLLLLGCAGDARTDAGFDAALALDAGSIDGGKDAGRDEDAGRDADGGRDAGMDAGSRDSGSCPCPRSVGCASEGEIVCAPAPEYPCESSDGWYAVCTESGWECRFTLPAIC